MLKILAAILALGLLGSACTGIRATQEPSPATQPPNEDTLGNHGRGYIQYRLDALSKQLSLSNEQKHKIRPLLKREAARIKEVQDNSSLSAGQVRRRIAQIHRETNKHIAQYLTPEQKTQWQATHQEHRGGQASANRSPAPGGQEGPAHPGAPANP
jgi:Spy/CpxP family protein refolding chaperone